MLSIRTVLNSTFTRSLRLAAAGTLLAASVTQAALSFSFVQTATGVTVTASGETPSWFSSGFGIPFAQQGLFGLTGADQIMGAITNNPNYMGANTYASIDGDVPWSDSAIIEADSASGSSIGFVYDPDSSNLTIYSAVGTGSTALPGGEAYYTSGQTLADFGFTPTDIANGSGSFSFLDAGSASLLDVNWTTSIVPEPSTYAMIFGSLIGVVACLRRRKQQ